jgi:hypothetical protein
MADADLWYGAAALPRRAVSRSFDHRWRSRLPYLLEIFIALCAPLARTCSSLALIIASKSCAPGLYANFMVKAL